ncbi:MAG: hypothetical protein R6V25_13045 [Desulfatiglandales bacterium]
MLHQNLKPLIFIFKENVPISNRKNMAFAGAAITSGRAMGVVAATGMNCAPCIVKGFLKQSRLKLEVSWNSSSDKT